MLLTLVLVYGVHLSGTLGSQVQYGFKRYTQYEPGTMHLIITAPHGGPLTPEYQSDDRQTWPNRTFGCKDSAGRCVWEHVSKSCKKKDKCKASVINDKYTLKIARDIANRIEAITGDRPHVVYSRLHRRKLDANRELNEATFNLPDAKRAYKDYHGFIQKAINAIGHDHDHHGLILDIHGQNHTTCVGERTELGYLIPGRLLNSGIYSYRMTSLRGLYETTCRGLWWKSFREHCFKQLISGYASLGFYMNIASLPAVPSPFMEKPGNKKDGYFSGGYTVKKYGSGWGRHVDAIQIEFPNGLRSQLAKKNKCLRKMRNKVVLAILCFFKTNYHYSPQSSGWWPWRTTNPKIKTFNEFTKKCPHTQEIDTDLRKRNLDRQI